MMDELDRAIKNLDTLQHREVIHELTKLVVLYIRARASKKVHKAIYEGHARVALCCLSKGARTVLEAALKGG